MTRTWLKPDRRRAQGVSPYEHSIDARTSCPVPAGSRPSATSRCARAAASPTRCGYAGAEVEVLRRRRGAARPRSPPTARPASCRCCTAPPGRTARCATCSTASACPTSGRDRAGLPAARSTSRSPRRSCAGAGVAVPESMSLPHATFRELGAGRRPRRGGGPARPAAHGEADPGRVVARRLRRPRRPTTCPAAMVAAFAYGDTAYSSSGSSPAPRSRCRSSTTGGARALPVVEIVARRRLLRLRRPLHRRRHRVLRARRGCPTTCSRVRGDCRDACTRRSGCATGRAATSSSTPTARPWFLEVNVAPGMTETSTFPQAVAAAGLDLGERHGRPRTPGAVDRR